MKIQVYTVLTGDYETLNNGDEIFEEDGLSVDYVCFTDNQNLESDYWKFYVVNPTEDSQALSRHLKMLRVNQSGGYALSIYKDNCVKLKKGSLIALIDSVGDSDLVFFAHDRRKYLIQEFIACEVFRKDKKQRIRKHFQKYLKLDSKILLDKVVWGGFFLVNHRSRKTNLFLESWHQEFLLGARRDQLSLSYAVRQSGANIRILDMSNSKSSWHEWPLSLGRSKSQVQTDKWSSKFKRKLKWLLRYIRIAPWYWFRFLLAFQRLR